MANRSDIELSSSLSMSMSPSPGPKVTPQKGSRAPLPRDRHTRTDRSFEDAPPHRHSRDTDRPSSRAPLRLDDAQGSQHPYPIQGALRDPYLPVDAEHRYRGSQARSKHADDRVDDHRINGMPHDRWQSARHADDYDSPHAPFFAPSFANNPPPPVASDAVRRDRHAQAYVPQAEMAASASDAARRARQRQGLLSQAEQQNALAAAKQLDRSVDNLMARLLVAYGKPAEAIGNAEVHISNIVLCRALYYAA